MSTPDALSPAPMVSVVVPAYNRGATIRPALESVLRQTWSDFELIVVDDGSADDTMAEAAKVIDPRLRLTANPRNMGAAAARNTGVREARGTWVAFQDSDDEWLPHKLEKQMARLTAPGADYVGAYCGLLTLGGFENRAGERLRLRYYPDPSIAVVDGDILTSLLRTNLISTQTLVVRRDLVHELGYFDEETTPIEDWDFVVRLASRGRIAFVDEPLVHQRFSPNSISRNADRRLRSQHRLVDKNSALFAGHDDLRALQYYAIAGGYRKKGEFAAASRYLALARGADPANPRIPGHVDAGRRARPRLRTRQGPRRARLNPRNPFDPSPGKPTPSIRIPACRNPHIMLISKEISSGINPRETSVNLPARAKRSDGGRIRRRRSAFPKAGASKKSIVFTSPWSSAIVGCQSSSVFARVMSGRRCIGSSSGSGM